MRFGSSSYIQKKLIILIKAETTEIAETVSYFWIITNTKRKTNPETYSKYISEKVFFQALMNFISSKIVKEIHEKKFIDSQFDRCEKIHHMSICILKYKYIKRAKKAPKCAIAHRERLTEEFFFRFFLKNYIKIRCLGYKKSFQLIH